MFVMKKRFVLFYSRSILISVSNVNKSACLTYGMCLKLITDCLLKGLPLEENESYMF